MSLNSIIDYDEAQRRYRLTGRFQPYIMPLYPQPAIRRAAVARAPRYNPLQFALNQGNRVSDAEMNAAYDAAMAQHMVPNYSLVPSPAQQRVNNARIGGYLGIEKKYIDYEYNAAISNAVAGSEADPATALALNSIAQGDGPTDRDGRQVTLKSVHLRGMIRTNADIVDPDTATGAANGFVVKLVLLLDTQTNGAQFNAEDVFVEPSNGTLASFTFRELQHQKRFRVLKDLMLTVPAATATRIAGQSENNSPTTPNNFDTSAVLVPARMVPFEMNHEFKGVGKNELKTIYTGNTATVASISDNSLHLMAVKVDEASGASAYILSYVSRVRFVG